MSTDSPIGRASWWITATAAAVTALVFAWNVHRWSFIGDDAFISFRYARNLVEGAGLVWNPGERVEGYTNFLWTLMMAGAMALGLAPETVSNTLGIASGAAILVLLFRTAARRWGASDPLVGLAPLALAANRSFAAWCTGGLETTFFTLLAWGGVFAFLTERERRTPVPFASALLLAAATLTRPEGLLFAGVAGAFFVADLLRGRASPRALLCWLACYAAIVGAHEAWRIAYYGDWLPNTFRAKVPGLWWEQGLRYLGLFHRDHGVGWFLPLALLPLVRGGERAVQVLLALVVAFAVYVAAIGGDRFEFRFMVFVLPGMYWLVAAGLRVLLRGRGPVRASAVAAIALAFVAVNLRAAAAREPEDERHGVASLRRIGDYAARRADEGRFLRQLVDSGRLPADLVLAVGGAGALPYYSRLPAIDRRGINDAYVARQPVVARGVIGHERDAPYRYLERRGVALFDVLNQLVHPCPPAGAVPETIEHDGRQLPLRIVRAGDRCLIGATLLPDAAFRRAFAGLEVLR